MKVLHSIRENDHNTASFYHYNEPRDTTTNRFMKAAEDQPCALCERIVELQFHHLIPRKVHRRAHFRRHFSKQQLASGEFLCRQCHRGIHKFFDEMTLAKHYCSLDLLRKDPQVQRHITWVKKQRQHEKSRSSSTQRKL